jgi:hypothetical protein
VFGANEFFSHYEFSFQIQIMPESMMQRGSSAQAHFEFRRSEKCSGTLYIPAPKGVQFPRSFFNP